MAEAMYQQQAQGQNPNQGNPNDDVVDADFEAKN